MGKRGYPFLTAAEVRNILRKRGFTLKSTEGSHEQWEGEVGGQRRVVTVDENCSPFGAWHLKRMIEQSRLSRKKFYGSTKTTAKKYGCKYLLAASDPQTES